MPDHKPPQYPSLITEVIKRFFLPKTNIDAVTGNILTPPPPATLFIPSPLVVGGGKDTAQRVEKIVRQFPDIKRHVKQVDFLPNGYMMERLNKAGLQPEDWDSVNLLGSTNMKTKKVNIYQHKGPVENTLMHEFSHAADANEDKATELGNLFQTLLERGKK